jgi:hypothetical protein
MGAIGGLVSMELVAISVKSREACVFGADHEKAMFNYGARSPLNKTSKIDRIVLGTEFAQILPFVASDKTSSEPNAPGTS